MNGQQMEDDSAYVGHYDWTEIAPTTAIVEVVADANGSAPNEIEPLYDVVDPDAVDALFEDTDRTESDLELSFGFDAYSVTVRSDGTVLASSQS